MSKLSYEEIKNKLIRDRDFLSSVAASIARDPEFQIIILKSVIPNVATKRDLELLEGRLIKYVDAKMDSIINLIRGLDKRIDDLDKRIDALDKRIDSLDRRIDSLDRRIDALDKRIDSLDKRISMLQWVMIGWLSLITAILGIIISILM